MKHSLLFFSLFPVASFAAEAPLYVGDELVVTATRTPVSQSQLLADVTVINAADIAKSGQISTLELLKTQPGVEVVQTGGAGMGASVFLRGANSSHTLLLIDGFRVNSATLGLSAFENIPLEAVDRIEIVRGASSSLYGSDAVGGVIQIFTKNGTGAPHATVSANFGSYSTRNFRGGVDGRAGRAAFSLNVGQTESASFAPVNNPANPSFNSANHGFRNANVSGKFGFAIDANHEVGFTLFNSQNDTHYNGSFPSPATFPYHLQQTNSAYGLYSKDRFGDGWQSVLRIGRGIDDQIDSNSVATADHFRTDQNQLSWQNDIEAGPGLVTLGVEQLQQKIVSNVAYATDRRSIRSFFGGYQASFGMHSVQLNARSDANSQFGSHNTGSIGYGYRVSDAWRIAASTGTAFKAPTFNDLYFPGGNPNLLPERALNREIGVKYDAGLQHFSATYYDNRVSDLIAWTPIAPGSFIWAPANTNLAKLTGISLAYQGSFAEYRISANLDSQNPRDGNTGLILPLRARQHGAVKLERTLGRLTSGAELAVSGSRYNDAANTTRLGGYGLTNLFVKYDLDRQWAIHGRVNNLFDKQYQMVQDYATAGINFLVGIEYHPN